MNSFIKPEWLLFDLDNTLLDFTKSSKLAFYDLYNDLKLDESAEIAYKIYSEINHGLWDDREAGLISAEELKLKRWNLTFEALGIAKDAMDANTAYFEGIIRHVEFVDYAKELLEVIFGKFRMMIVTNGLSEVQHSRIEISKIGKYFEHIVISDEIGSAKPQKAYFEHCQNLMENPDKKSVLLIGDTLKSDIKGANDFGYPNCWFNHDYLEGNGLDIPNYEINKLKELISILGI